MLAATRIAAAAASVDPSFLNSPLFESISLGNKLGIRLLLKDETDNPIHCFKGRGADWWMQCRSPRRVVCASAGNFGQAVAWAGRRHGCEVTVFVSENANPSKVAAIRALGATIVAEGADFDAAKVAAERHSAEHDLAYVEDGRDDEIAEGAGTLAAEITSDGVFATRIYLPVGNGALLNGVGSWLRSASPATEIIGVCASGAPAMYRSWTLGSAVETEAANTLADGVATRVPIQIALDHMVDTVDRMMLVDDGAILAAMRELAAAESMAVEPAGAIALAAAFKDTPQSNGGTVVIPLTGSNLDPRLIQV